MSGPSAQDGIPSLKEQGIDVVLGNWRGVFGAPAITAAQRDALVSRGRRPPPNRPRGRIRSTKIGWESVYLGGDAFKTFLDEDIKRIGAILESLGLRK